MKSFLNGIKRYFVYKKKRRLGKKGMKREGCRPDIDWNAVKIWANSESTRRKRDLTGESRFYEQICRIRERMGRKAPCSHVLSRCDIHAEYCDTVRRWQSMIGQREIAIYLAITLVRAMFSVCWYVHAASGTFSSQCGHCFSATGYPGLSHQHGHGGAGG